MKCKAKNAIFAFLMVFIMAFGFLPQNALVANADENDNSPSVEKYQVTNGGLTDEGGLYSLKTLDFDKEKKEGTITLETYAKGTLESSEVSKPADIVLVLDVSGSMDDCLTCGNSSHGPFTKHDFKSRISALKTAVNDFIETVNKEAANNNVDHRIAIVKFAGSKSDEVGNHTYEERDGIWTYTYNYSQIVKQLTSVKANADSLKASVTALKAAGSTSADYGMQHAQSIIEGISEDRDSSKVVVMFTDGEPNHENGFDSGVANGAISASKDIKDKSATVYTVGMFATAPASDSDVAKYMNYVSSNYPNAVDMDPKVEGKGDGYYQTVNDTAGLNAIFEKIKQELAKPQIDLTKDSVVKDIISDSFKLNTEAAGPIKVQTCDYKGNDTEDNPIWDAPKDAEGVKATVEGKTVSVTGFDFEKEYILTKDNKPQGKKLVITIPVKLTADALNGGVVQSNGAGSGIYKNDTDETPMRDFTSPAVQKAVQINYIAEEGGTVSTSNELVAHNGTAKGATATAKDGYYFVNWTDQDGEVFTSAEYVPKTKMATYTAHFQQKRSINVIADSAHKTYDGTPLTKSEYTLEGKLVDGDVLTAKVDGSQTDAGEGKNVVVENSVKIMRGDKDVTDQYTIATTDGNLTVSKRSVTLTSGTASKVYDGKPLTKDTVEVSEDGFVRDEGASYNVTGSQRNVGESKNTFTYTLKNGTNAKNYNIKKVEGTLTVTKPETQLIIQANSNNKMYDGEPLSDDGYTYTEGVLQNGDKLKDVQVEGRIKDVGTADNEVKSYKVVREENGGEINVTDNYNIGTAKGVLAVTPRTVTITSGTASNEYNGKPFTFDDIYVTGDGFADGEGATYDVTGTVTNVSEGEVENKFTYTLNNNTNKDNYNIETYFGTLKINPAVLYITADDKTKVQGDENPALTGTIAGFVNGETAATALKGDAAYATTAEKNSPVGTYPIQAGAGTLVAINGNYVFQYIDGVLTVVEPGTIIDGNDPAGPTDADEVDDATGTGDDFNLWLYVVLAIGAAAAAVTTVLRRKVRR